MEPIAVLYSIEPSVNKPLCGIVIHTLLEKLVLQWFSKGSLDNQGSLASKKKKKKIGTLIQNVSLSDGFPCRTLFFGSEEPLIIP